MNHPKPEEWLVYLDGESSPEAAKQLFAHLQDCPECAAQVDGWRRTIQKLQRLPTPARQHLAPKPKPAAGWVVPFLRYALPALAMVFAGFTVGRFSSASAGPMKQAIANQVRTELRQQMRADLLGALGPDGAARDTFQQRLRTELSAAVLQAANNNDKRTLQDFMNTVQQQRESDQRNLLALINHLRDLQVADCLALRQDLETAVTTADNDLRQNRNSITQLASTLLADKK